MKRDAAEEQRLVDQLRVFQLQKLERDRGKGHWAGESVISLFCRAREEMQELAAAMAVHCARPDDIARECADVANFCAMIADLALSRSKEKA